eukprot:TRINITY_DN3208_c0_g1_i18.p3 TRINITY_DN3208_c0_g1~~TRINITY_DN3208_c0_g1_i18.p3  ORF type:complete len:105 (-),score=6.05 TRINITY_DN3208_c0_g1_i18:3-317(-)
MLYNFNGSSFKDSVACGGEIQIHAAQTHSTVSPSNFVNMKKSSANEFVPQFLIFRLVMIPSTETSATFPTKYVLGQESISPNLLFAPEQRSYHHFGLLSPCTLR